MRKYLYCENGFVEKPQWMPNCWVNVECPDQSDFDFLTKELKIQSDITPESKFESIADATTAAIFIIALAKPLIAPLIIKIIITARKIMSSIINSPL